MMTVNFVGKRILLVGIVLLSLAWLGQPALADDDDDDQGYDDGCAPLIKAVHMDLDNNLMSILGECFYSEDQPKVTLCGVELEYESHSPAEIMVRVFDVPEGACHLSVCMDDEDGDCDRYWLPAYPRDFDPEMANTLSWGVLVTANWDYQPDTVYFNYLAGIAIPNFISFKKKAIVSSAYTMAPLY